MAIHKFQTKNAKVRASRNRNNIQPGCYPGAIRVQLDENINKHKVFRSLSHTHDLHGRAESLKYQCQSTKTGPGAIRVLSGCSAKPYYYNGLAPVRQAGAVRVPD